IIWLDSLTKRSTPDAPPMTSPIVASLSDQIDAAWDRDYKKPGIDGEMPQDTYRLNKGHVSIKFNSGAKVTIEAPAEWAMLTDNKMELFRGSLYAVVPDQAHGFTVNALGSSIVDLGTEFGVSVKDSDSCDVHVLKGKVELATRRKNVKRIIQKVVVRENQAKSIDYMTGKTEDINLSKKGFVRHIDSETGFAWNGQDIDLADIIGGGNGFGTGKKNYGIDMRTGSSVRVVDSKNGMGDNKYLPVSSNKYVDGIFVPDGGNGKIKISTTGLMIDCPDTDNMYYSHINICSSLLMQNGQKHTLTLDGKEFGPKESFIYMHSNKGITFDLKEFRRSVFGSRMGRFTAKCGISSACLLSNIRAEFWVLIDGEIVFRKMLFYSKKGRRDIADIDIVVPKKARFITLMVTDGGLYKGLAHSGDWGLFALPKLEIMNH
ncbi:MAG: hypothetical protein GY799_26350, partial [Desulfobulbaceae bacterium]|nr:hypothetical protein [Desulfobulbaceae bacterium]